MAHQITSASNPLIKTLKTLHMKKGRVETGLFLAEGARLAVEAAELGVWPDTLVYAPAARERPQVRAHVGITLQPKRSRDVLARLQKIPELLQLSSVSGEFDYIAVLRADTTARLDVLLDEIGEIEGVHKTTTSVVLALRIDRGS